MPNRTLRESILTSDSVNQLDWREEVFYRRLMSVVDDFGRFDARAVVLRPAIFPLALDRMSNSDVEGCLAKCAAVGLVRVYKVDGREYLEVQKFQQRTRSKYGSKYPAPPADDGQMTVMRRSDDGLDEDVDEDVDVDENILTNTPLDKAALLSARNAAGQGVLSKKTHERPEKALIDAALGVDCGATAKAPPRESSAHVEATPDLTEVANTMQSLAFDIFRNPKLLEECAACFIDTFEARGWCDARGNPIRNWQPAARNFARSFALNRDRRPATPQQQKRNDCNDPERYR